MTRNCSKSLLSKLFRISVCAPLLACAISYPAHAQNAQEGKSVATPANPLLQRHVMLPSSVPPDPSRHRSQLRSRVTAKTNLISVNPGPGIVFTCDPNVDATHPGACEYLNTTVAGYYNSVFTNANAKIYIQFGTTGLGESLQAFNFVTYSQYLAALNALPNKNTIQTDAITALNTYDAAPYGGGNVQVTSALGTALGFTGLYGINAAGTQVCAFGTDGCYNVIITVTNDPNTPLYYDDDGGTEPFDAYDYYAVVMHETDETLGTSSCIGTNNNTLTDNCAGAGGDGVPSAVDLFRYTGVGTLALTSAPSTDPGLYGQYFSYDGGAHYGVQGDANAGVAKVYNTLANGDDFADFAYTDSSDCSYNEAIQDAEGCPGGDQGLTVLNDGEAEFTMLAAVGYQLPGSSSPSPAVISSPAPGSTLTGSSAVFKWAAVSGVTKYDLHVGTTAPGSYDINSTGSITSTSKTITGIPVNGAQIYARLYSWINGAWQFTDSTYTAATLGHITAPAPGSKLTGSSVTFTWAGVATAKYYDLHISAIGPGGADLYSSGGTSATSRTVAGLPVNGERIYVRLMSYINGAWQNADYVYTAANLAQITAPSPGSTFTSTSVKFTWSAPAGVVHFDLHISAIGRGGADLYSSGSTTATNATANIPANGAKVYVRLESLVGAAWEYVDYTYTAK
jgi:hypothetical protein